MNQNHQKKEHVHLGVCGTFYRGVNQSFNKHLTQYVSMVLIA